MTEPPKSKYPRKPRTFSLRDVTSAIKAAVAAGLEVQGYDIDTATGKITVRTGKPVVGETVNPLIQRLRVVKP
jgi:hypothetical protein